MHLDGPFCKVHIAGNLFAKAALRDLSHDLTLARAQRFETFPECSQRLLTCPPGTITSEAGLDGIKIGQPRRLFGYFNDGGRKHWDVSPDGQRFLVELENLENATADVSPITLVVNWAAGLRK